VRRELTVRFDLTGRHLESDCLWPRPCKSARKYAELNGDGAVILGWFGWHLFAAARRDTEPLLPQGGL